MADMPEITHTEPSQVLLDPSAFSLPPRARNIAQKRKTGLELKLEKPGPADWARIHPDGTGGSGGGPEANTNSTGSRFSAATSTPFGIAVDRNGNLWMANSGASGTVADTYSSISYLAVSNNSSTGTGGIMSSVTSTSTAGGLNIPQDIEIDGNNNAWVANYTQNAIGVGAVPYQISEFSFNGTTIVPVTSGGLIWSDRVNLRNLWVCCCRCYRRFSRTERAAVGAVFSDD